MRPNPQFLGDLVTFTKEILHGKVNFLCSVYVKLESQVKEVKFIQSNHSFLMILEGTEIN